MRELASLQKIPNLHAVRAGFASLSILARSSCVGVIARLEAEFLCVVRYVLWDAEDGGAFLAAKLPRHPHLMGVRA